MKSTYKIIWTNNALSELQKILEYLESTWSKKEISKFFKKFDRQLMLLSGNPYMYPISEKKESVRRSVVNKRLTLYYKIDINSIYLLSLFDNRRNPESINL